MAANSRSDAPQRAGIVLGSLIAVAAVANLGLAVANVALPSIGQHFDASQTALNLVAVGYSLGLAASVLYFGAVGDRYGRKLLLVLGMVLTVPADCLAAWAPSIDVLFGARVHRGARGGDGVPDDAGVDHGSVVGAGADEVDRALGGDGRRDRRARPALRRDPAGALLVGVGVPAHAAAGADRARHGGQARAESREREHGAGRPHGRRALDLPRRRADPGDQLRRRPERDHPGPGPVHRRRGCSGRVLSSGSGARRTRSTT